MLACRRSRGTELGRIERDVVSCQIGTHELMQDDLLPSPQLFQYAGRVVVGTISGMWQILWKSSGQRPSFSRPVSSAASTYAKTFCAGLPGTPHLGSPGFAQIALIFVVVSVVSFLARSRFSATRSFWSL